MLPCEQLTGIIRKEIDSSQGYISFARFMELALYAPELGYYSAETHKLGKEGDFVTAPEISPLFSKCIARQCHQIFSEIKSCDFLEIGAGTGRFAKDLMLELESLSSLPEHYYIFDISANLRKRQQTFIQTHCPHLFSKFIWLKKLPQNFNGVIFANEVMDAFPVHCFRIEDTIYERSVCWQENQFNWQLTTPSSKLLQEVTRIKTEYNLEYDYESEVCLKLPEWIASLAKVLQQGIILLSDYGYGRKEYYHPDRHRGTLMCFYQQKKHDDPFSFAGLQDITTHVDFTAVIEAAVKQGLSLSGYNTQAAFLLGCGLLENPLSIEETYAVKMLTLPGQMGELCKLMALSKNFDLPLRGFNLYDLRKFL